MEVIIFDHAIFIVQVTSVDISNSISLGIELCNFDIMEVTTANKVEKKSACALRRYLECHKSFTVQYIYIKERVSWVLIQLSG